MTQLTRLRGWHRAISGIRPRILVWYFLLTTSAVLMSIGVTRQMYCDRLKAKAQDSLVQEVQRFRLLANQQRQDAVQSSENVAALFDRFLASYMPTRNEYIITLLNDQIYKSSPTVPKNLLDKHPSLMREWTKTAQPLQGELDTTEARIVYVAEPVRIGSNASETSSQNASGLIVAIHDSTADYQAGTSAIALVIKVTIVVLILFTLLAWVTTGRVLSPLRLLTKTAQSITESDMAQRISVKGADEIAELTLTFNEMLDRLQFAFDSQQTFLKDVSHELRTPITVIQGHLEMLKYQPEKQGETIALDLLTRQVWVGDRLVELSTREFLLAEVFLRHPMQVMTREQLLDRIWGYDYEPGTNIVNVYVGHLRRKLGEDRIETVRGVGYRLRV